MPMLLNIGRDQYYVYTYVCISLSDPYSEIIIVSNTILSAQSPATYVRTYVYMVAGKCACSVHGSDCAICTSYARVRRLGCRLVAARQGSRCYSPDSFGANVCDLAEKRYGIGSDCLKEVITRSGSTALADVGTRHVSYEFTLYSLCLCNGLSLTVKSL